MPHMPKQRGIALMMTLIISVLLAVLTGAFITVNRANSSITGNVVTRQDAYNACLSGLHFAWAQLEKDQGFGAEGFPDGISTVNLPLSSPEIRLRIHGDSEEPTDINLNYIEGEILSSGDRFEIRFVNNLANRNVNTASPLGDVPGRCTRLEIVGMSGTKRLTLSSVLRKAPFVDSSALSSYDMSIEVDGTGPTNRWNLRSKDPYVNQVRSNMNISGPSAIDGHLKFDDPPRGGVAMAQDDIRLGGVSVSGDPTFLADSQEAANGSLQTASGVVEVPDLERHNLTFPPTEVSVPPGEMEMGFVEVHRWTETVLEGGISRWRKQTFSHNSIEHAGNIWVSETSEPLTDSGVITDPTQGYDTPDTLPGVQGHPGVTEFSDLQVLYDDGQDDSDHKMVADLATGAITLSPGTTFEVEGDLRIKQNEDAPQAHLLFGYEFEGDVPIFRGGDNAMDNVADSSAVITTEGDLFIDGITTGFGSLYADQTVDLRAKSGLRAEQDLAVAVHGNTINFTAEEPPDASVTNTLSQAEFVAFGDGLGPQYDRFDSWFALETLAQLPQIGTDPLNPVGVRSNRLSENGDYYWNLIMEDLERNDDPPNWSSFGPEWTGNLNLEQFVRLQQYAKEGGNSWFEMPGPHFDYVTGHINDRISTYSGWAHRMNLPMSEYMQEEIATIADVYFVGLVHAGEGGFRATAAGGSMLFEGSLVSQGQISVSETKALDFVYNRTYLDDVVKQFVGSSRANLDQVYYRLQ